MQYNYKEIKIICQEGLHMRDLTKGNIYKTFLLFAIPMVFAGVLSQCYSVVNTVIAGKLLGEESLAAIGAIAPLESFLNGLFGGYGMGLGMYTAFLFGAKKYQRMRQVIVSNTLFLTGIIVVITTILICFRGQVYSFLNIDPNVQAECNLYFSIQIASKAVQIFAINSVYIINGMGDSRFPFFISLLSTVFNILLSILAVAGFGLGVEGIALTNTVSASVVSICYFVKMKRCFRQLGVVGSGGIFSFRAICETARYSVFAMIQQSVMTFSGLILSPMINAIGSAASASYTVTLRVYDVNAVIYQNSAKTLGNYTAQCYGAKRYDLLKKGIWVGLLQNLLFVLPVLLVSILAAPFVASIFYADHSATVSVQYTISFLRYFMPFLIFNIIANLFHNFFRGIGCMTVVLFSTLTGTVIRIVAGLLLIPYFGIYGYYIGWVLFWIFDGLTGLIFYRFGKWRRILKS